MKNIESQIQDAVNRRLLATIQFCQGYETCSLVKFRGTIYYYPELTEEHLHNLSSFTCPKHKEQYLREGRIQDLIEEEKK